MTRLLCWLRGHRWAVVVSYDDCFDLEYQTIVCARCGAVRDA